jgi:hypothetical protein
MKIFTVFVFLVLCLTQLSWGDSIETHLFSLEKASEDSPQMEVLTFSSPRILYLDSENTESLITARLAIQMGSPVSLEVDSSTAEISKITLAQEKKENLAPRSFRWNPGLYSPSLISNYLKTKTLFDSVDSYSDADLSDDCYNRAHYWARAFEVDHKVNSMKVFVLFTAGYRKENNFNWWYHVAPYVNAKGTDGEYEIVLDPSYEKLPISLKKWVFHFASKANSCRKLKSLHDYKATEDEGGCVVITASMYHYTPQDLDPENPPVGWRCEDIRDIQKALRAPAPYQDWADYTAFLPNHCY